MSQLRIALSRAEADTDEARAQARAWEDRAHAEQRARDDAALAAGELALRLRDEARVARADELYAERRRTAALERRVADRDAVLASVAAHAQALEERLALADTERAEAEWREWRLRDAWREDRALLVGPGRDEKEWRQRARADGREMDGLRDDVALAERERADEREWDSVRGEWERRRDKAARDEKKRMERDFEVVEGECVLLSLLLTCASLTCFPLTLTLRPQARPRRQRRDPSPRSAPRRVRVVPLDRALRPLARDGAARPARGRSRRP